MEREALERVSRPEAESATMLTSAREDAEGLARKITLLKDKLAAEHWAQEVSQRERQEQFEELNLLKTWGSELCHAIIGPRRVRHQLTEGMRLAAQRAVVSTTTESVLGRSPSNTFHVEVVSELATEF
jgi:hypothetical protein